jgi:hypothetical protein
LGQNWEDLIEIVSMRALEVVVGKLGDGLFGEGAEAHVVLATKRNVESA